MSAASALALDVPPLQTLAPMAEAAATMAAHALDTVPVVLDRVSRKPVGVVRQADVEACVAAGDDPQVCLVQKHLSAAYVVAHPEDSVDFVERAGSGTTGVALVVGEDGRLSGVIVAPTGKSLDVTPVYKVQPMAGGVDGMELIWRCGDCGHIVQQVASPPDRCPSCSAPREHFFRVTED